MRTAITLILGLVAASAIGIGLVEAQTQPEAFSWERKTNQLLQPTKINRLDRAQRVRNRDLRQLNLPKNRIFGSNTEAIAAPQSPDLTRYSRLDSDRDGSISRSEYLTGRSRPVRAGASGATRNNSRQSRLHSRFRAADRNRDGRLSASELQNVRNRRF
jgi:hypothetical protein